MNLFHWMETIFLNEKNEWKVLNYAWWWTLTELRNRIITIINCLKKLINQMMANLYCKLVRYSFIFDSFRASQAVYRNLWYIKSPLWKVICLLLGWFATSAQVAKRSNILTAQNKRISNKHGVHPVCVRLIVLNCIVE